MVAPVPLPPLNISQTPISSGGNLGPSPVTYGDVSTGFSSVGGIPQIFVIGVGVLAVCVILKALKKKSS